MQKLHSFIIEEKMMPKVIELLTAHGFKDLKRQTSNSLCDFTGTDSEGHHCFIESRVRSENAVTQHLAMKVNKLSNLLELSQVAPVYVIFINKHGHALVDVKKLASENKITTGNTVVQFIKLGAQRKYRRNSLQGQFMKDVDVGPLKRFSLSRSKSSLGKHVIRLTPERQKQLVGIFSRRNIDYDAVSKLLNLGCWVFLHSLSRQHIWSMQRKLRKKFEDLLVFRANLGTHSGYAFVTETKGKKIPTALVRIKHEEKTVNNKNANNSSEQQ